MHDFACDFIVDTEAQILESLALDTHSLRSWLRSSMHYLVYSVAAGANLHETAPKMSSLTFQALATLPLLYLKFVVIMYLLLGVS